MHHQGLLCSPNFSASEELKGCALLLGCVLHAVDTGGLPPFWGVLLRVLLGFTGAVHTAW